MPFKSEKQRRYLFANEPEIARDWTETYGSKIQKADGGIMRVPFQGGGGMDASQPDFSPPSAKSTRPSRPDRSPREERIMAGPPPTMAQRDIAAGVGRGGRGSLADPMEKQDYTTQKYTGSFLDNVFSRGYRPVTPTGQFQSRFSQYGGNILSGIMGAVNPFLGFLSQGFQKFGPAFNNFRSSQTLEQFRDKMRGYGRTMPIFSNNPSFGGIETLGVERPMVDEVSMEENIIPLQKPTSLYNLDDMLMSKPVFSKSPMADPMWGGIMEIDDSEETIFEKARRLNAQMKKPFSAELATHPYTGEAVHDRYPGRSLEFLSGLQNAYGIPQTFFRKYDNRNEPYPFIDYSPDDDEIARMRGYKS